MLSVLFIAQKQQQNSSTLDVNLKPLSPWLFLKGKKKRPPLLFFLVYPLTKNLLFYLKKYKKQLINTPTLLVPFFFYSPVMKDQHRERPS